MLLDQWVFYKQWSTVIGSVGRIVNTGVPVIGPSEGPGLQTRAVMAEYTGEIVI